MQLHLPIIEIQIYCTFEHFSFEHFFKIPRSAIYELIYVSFDGIKKRQKNQKNMNIDN